MPPQILTLPLESAHCGYQNRQIQVWIGMACRPQRVKVLLCAIVLLSLLDLGLTLRAMQTTGMFEANPIVAKLAKTTQSAAAISLFKLSTVVFGVGVLYGLRRRLASELAAWLLTGILSLLAIRWVDYLSSTIGQPLMLAMNDPAWVRLQ